jgi:hypothetical protein
VQSHVRIILAASGHIYAMLLQATLNSQITQKQRTAMHFNPPNNKRAIFMRKSNPVSGAG